MQVLSSSSSNSVPFFFSHIVLCSFGFHPNHFPFRTFNLLALVEHLSSSSRELCLYLLVAAFAIQVHESTFHRIRHDNDLRHLHFSLQAPASTRFLPPLSPLPSQAISTFFLVMPKPFPHPSSVSWHPAVFFASSFSFWYLHKSFSFLTISKASSVLLCPISFISSMI